MDLAVGHHQSLFGANTIQHPLMQGAVLYPGKGSAWQPVVTSLPTMVELPKESIIANTDFTTTSVIAKRRLSSKKRKNLESQQNRHSGCDGALSDGPANSPSDSAYGGSPSVTSATTTPLAQDRIELRHSSFQPPTISTTSTSSHHQQPLLHSTSSSFHPMVVHDPHTHHTHAHNQFSNPVLSHIQQELNYRFLSGGGQPDQSQLDQQPYPHVTNSSSRIPTGIKWCNAHVSVARMIQQHQAQLKAQETNALPQPLLSTIASSDTMDTSSSCQHVQGAHCVSQTDQSIAMSSQQQQLALLQLYGVHPTLTSTAGGPTMSATGGYLAMSYPGMHEMPLVSLSSLSQIDGMSNVAIALNPATGMQMAGSGVHQIPSYGPVATAVDTNGGMVIQGGGTWMAPVPMMGGNCIVNPLNPGILAAPWVK